MARRRFNCCIFNHPCPIFCPFSMDCTENEVVNPIVLDDYAFFNNLDIGTIASQAIIPVYLVQNRGTSIAPSPVTSGAVRLLAGTYEVTYLAGGTIPAGGNASIKLRLDGVDVSGSVLNETQTAGSTFNLTQTMIITVTQASTLELVNNSADATVFSYASMVFRRL